MKLLIIGPQTRTAGAQERLKRAGINAGKRKITETGEGCLHAVSVSDSDADRARRILSESGIKVRSVMEAHG